MDEREGHEQPYAELLVHHCSINEASYVADVQQDKIVSAASSI